MSVGVEDRSWLASANEANGFGLNHLPMGAFEAQDGEVHLGIAVGNAVVDLHVFSGLLPGLTAPLAAPLAAACRQASMNAFLRLGAAAWAELRQTVQRALREDTAAELRAAAESAMVPSAGLRTVYPLETRGFVDFYASVDHARRVGELFRPERPLLPNYEYVPIAYNGRASSLLASGMEVRRPWGQRRGEQGPVFAPTEALDYEAEVGLVVAHGNLPGEPIAVKDAPGHVFGVALLNDWSARDVQSWEYQPLGPFLGKSFATSMAGWVTPLAALQPFRVPARTKDVTTLPYLWADDDQQRGGLDMRMEVWLSTARSRREGAGAMRLSRGSTAGLFWTPAQMVAHAASNGCPLETGDVLATGTVSGPGLESAGCLLELTRNGTDPLRLPNGEERRWLEDGDEVTLRGWCERDGMQPVALGECTGRVAAAHLSVTSR